jgi:hypothetical protein
MQGSACALRSTITFVDLLSWFGGEPAAIDPKALAWAQVDTLGRTSPPQTQTMRIAHTHLSIAGTYPAG